LEEYALNMLDPAPSCTIQKGAGWRRIFKEYDFNLHPAPSCATFAGVSDPAPLLAALAILRHFCRALAILRHFCGALAILRHLTPFLPNPAPLLRGVSDPAPSCAI
jgi:hypothetical protein